MTTPPTDLRLGEPLGSGAVAMVVRVHAGDGRVYAGKLLHESHRLDEAAVRRFAQEAELLRGVKDDNLVEVIGLVEVQGRPVLLLELVEGPTLAQVIAREAPLGEARLAALGAGIARGLARAHAAGLVHRDLKPANVLVAGGHTPKIGDFGMARATSLAGTDRAALTVLGTPDYMAPECLDPLAVDGRSDLYALGCILYEMATARPPYSGPTAFGVALAHRRDPIPALPEGFSAGLRALVGSLLAKSPGDRPQAAAQVAAALEQIAAGVGTPLARVTKEVDGAACPGCGQPQLGGLGVCLNCGLQALVVERGEHTVLVTGPGEPGDQLDVALREALRRWIAGNPGLGVTPGRLAEKLPRVPFVVLRRVSEASGRAVCEELERLGLRAELVRGGALRSAKMRRKTRALIGRALLITIGSMAGFYSSLGRLLVLLPLVMLGVATVTGYRSLRQATQEGGPPRPALPPPLTRALAEVEQVAPTIDSTRHRHSLRAVVRRALALAPGSGEAAAELAEAVRAATVAAARLDALDRRLGAGDIQGADEALRATLHERDTWSERLLSLTASLDALHARQVAARRSAEDAELAELRARVEAIAEVQGSARAAAPERTAPALPVRAGEVEHG